MVCVGNRVRTELYMDWGVLLERYDNLRELFLTLFLK